jgi:hypothetical protein
MQLKAARFLQKSTFIAQDIPAELPEVPQEHQVKSKGNRFRLGNPRLCIKSTHFRLWEDFCLNRTKPS